MLLSVALLALAGSLGWLLRQKVLESRAHERAVLERAANARPLPAPPPPPAVTPATPADYLNVAEKTLFSQDRNPNVLVDPPKPPPPPPPMPPLPVYFGQMNFGVPVVILTVGKLDQKSYSVGDQVGDFLLESFDRDSIIFDWEGKTVERKLTELGPKDNQQKQAQQQTPPPAAAQVQAVAAPAAAPPPPPPSNKPAQIGNDMGGGFFACVSGDTAPNGTVSGGYKKIVTVGLMGQSCLWEQMK
jgi:hypothetical protein